MDDGSRTQEGGTGRPAGQLGRPAATADCAGPSWLCEGASIVHSALGAGRVLRIDDRAGRTWVRLRLDRSGAMLAMPLDQLRLCVESADDPNRPGGQGAGR